VARTRGPQAGPPVGPAFDDLSRSAERVSQVVGNAFDDLIRRVAAADGSLTRLSGTVQAVTAPLAAAVGNVAAVASRAGVGPPAAGAPAPVPVAQLALLSAQINRLATAQTATAARASGPAVPQTPAFARVGAGFAAVRSGEYAEQYRQTVQLSRAQRDLEESQRRVRLEVDRGKLGANLQLMGERLEGVGKAGRWAFAGITGTLGGFVRAGLQGTAEMDVFRLSMGQISREVASVFTPQINAAVAAVQRLAAWFRNLTGEQQHQARQWVGLALGVSGFLALLPRIVSTGSALAALGRNTGLAGLLGGLGTGGKVGLGVAGGMVGLLAMSREGREALATLAAAAAPVAEAFAKLAPAVAGLSAALGKVVGWVLENVPGAKGSKGGAGFNLAGAAAGGLAFGVPGAIAGYLLGGLVGEGVGKAAGPRIRDAGLEETRARLAEVEAGLKQMDRAPDWRSAQAHQVAESMRDALRERLSELTGGKEGRRKDVLTPSVGGFEQVADLYRRIATAGVKDPTQQTADNTSAIAAAARRIAEQIDALASRAGLPRTP
jgi:hypothetical protein